MFLDVKRACELPPATESIYGPLRPAPQRDAASGPAMHAGNKATAISHPVPPGVDTGLASAYLGHMDRGSIQTSEDVALKQAMGRAIAHSRIEAGFATQAAFARAMDVRFQYVSRVEKGEENLSLETLAKMTGILRCAMPQFLARVAEEMLTPSELPPPRRGRPQSG